MSNRPPGVEIIIHRTAEQSLVRHRVKFLTIASGSGQSTSPSNKSCFGGFQLSLGVVGIPLISVFVRKQIKADSISRIRFEQFADEQHIAQRLAHLFAS